MAKTLKQRLSELDKTKRNISKKEDSLSKEVLKEMKKLMTNNPLLVGVRWTQFTPHFNDGEPCVFDMYGPEIKFDESIVSLGEDAYNQGFVDTYYLTEEFFEKRVDILNMDRIAALQKAVKEVGKLYEHLYSMSRTMDAMFGDGYQVTITKDGVEAEEYDHD